ncbi:hypothetical protein EDB86DRAFT_2834154 [Lactarius hatsudake]|nr:hypothetical protein EDB86DRAFT_2834154 [Lactarius hatsudake]
MCGSAISDGQIIPPLTTLMQSDIAQPTTPAGPLVLVAQKRENEGGSGIAVGASPSLEPLDHQEPLPPSSSGRVSTDPPMGLHSSLSDTDISRSSGANPSNFNSRSRPPSSGRDAPEARIETVKTRGFEDDELVDELQVTPRFGKEMWVLYMTMPYDVPGEFAMDFHLGDVDYNAISLWVRAAENDECISLACYSIQDLEPHANQQQGPSREHWFENVRPVPYKEIPRVLWFIINDEFTILFPPYEASEDLLDVSPYLRMGENKLCFTQIDSMEGYVLVLHGHYPTQSQIAPLRARWDGRMRFREQLAWLTRPLSP